MFKFKILMLTYLTVTFFQISYATQGQRVKRKTVDNVEGIAWPGRIIPYEIQNGFTTDQLEQINEAMKEWMAVSCIKFEPFNSKIHKYKASINQNQPGCFSNLGYVGKILMNQRKPLFEQNINLNTKNGCTNRAIVLHEVGHALGLIHEHSRPDRDNYIDVIKDNVIPEQYPQLDKVTNGKTFDLPYEYQSIMHYSPNSFAKPGLYSFVTKDPTQMSEVFQDTSKPLAFSDIAAVNIMYNCGKDCKNICSKPGYLDKDCNCVTPWDYAVKACKDEKSAVECQQITNGGSKCHVKGRFSGYKELIQFTNEAVVRQCRKTCGECYRYIPKDWSKYPTAPQSIVTNKTDPIGSAIKTGEARGETKVGGNRFVETKEGNTIIETRKTETKILSNGRRIVIINTKYQRKN